MEQEGTFGGWYAWDNRRCEREFWIQIVKRDDLILGGSSSVSCKAGSRGTRDVWRRRSRYGGKVRGGLTGDKEGGGEE